MSMWQEDDSCLDCKSYAREVAELKRKLKAIEGDHTPAEWKRRMERLKNDGIEY